MTRPASRQRIRASDDSPGPTRLRPRTTVPACLGLTFAGTDGREPDMGRA